MYLVKEEAEWIKQVFKIHDPYISNSTLGDIIGDYRTSISSLEQITNKILVLYSGVHLYALCFSWSQLFGADTTRVIAIYKISTRKLLYVNESLLLFISD